MQRHEWQEQNLAALSDRLQWLHDEEEGTLFSEPSGTHFVVVTKEDAHICLWLYDEANASTGVIQSELDLADPLKLVDAYTQAALLGLLWVPEPQQIFTTGLGGGCLPTVLHHHLPETSVQCVEVDAVVAEAAQQLLWLPSGRKPAHCHRRWPALAGTERGRWRNDILFIDAFEDDGDVPSHLTSVEFFKLCRASLSDHGVLDRQPALPGSPPQSAHQNRGQRLRVPLPLRHG